MTEVVRFKNWEPSIKDMIQPTPVTPNSISLGSLSTKYKVCFSEQDKKVLIISSLAALPAGYVYLSVKEFNSTEEAGTFLRQSMHKLTRNDDPRQNKLRSAIGDFFSVYSGYENYLDNVV